MRRQTRRTSQCRPSRAHLRQPLTRPRRKPGSRRRKCRERRRLRQQRRRQPRVILRGPIFLICQRRGTVLSHPRTLHKRHRHRLGITARDRRPFISQRQRDRHQRRRLPMRRRVRTRERLHHQRRIMQPSSVRRRKLPHDCRPALPNKPNNAPPPRLPLGSRRNNTQRRKLPHDSRPALPNKPNNAPPLKPLPGSRRNSARWRTLPHDSRPALPNKPNNAPPPKPPLGSRRNNARRRTLPHDSRPALPNKPNNAPPLKPPLGSSPLNRGNSARLLPHSSSTRKLAGIPGSRLARSDGRRSESSRRYNSDRSIFVAANQQGSGREGDRSKPARSESGPFGRAREYPGINDSRSPTLKPSRPANAPA